MVDFSKQKYYFWANKVKKIFKKTAYLTHKKLFLPYEFTTYYHQKRIFSQG